MTAESMAKERQREMFDRLIKLAPINTAHKVRVLADTMFSTARNTYLPEPEMTQALAMLTGMACAALIGYADLLDKQQATEEAHEDTDEMARVNNGLEPSGM